MDVSERIVFFCRNSSASKKDQFAESISSPRCTPKHEKALTDAEKFYLELDDKSLIFPPFEVAAVQFEDMDVDVWDFGADSNAIQRSEVPSAPKPLSPTEGAQMIVEALPLGALNPAARFLHKSSSPTKLGSGKHVHWAPPVEIV
mmetsp:Transcript_43763/g.116905  ORF Transcript_43763/g.116905 Transcript_43763/m.116905 type:complete len:145 (-) Transcript_43763:142-576(-)